MNVQVISEFNIGHKKNSIYHSLEQFLVQLWRQQEKQTHGHYPAVSYIVCWHDIEMNEDHNLLYLHLGYQFDELPK